MKPIVKLIAITQGAGELAGKTAQEVITYNARVSNPGNQNNFNTAAGLLRFCIREEHWSIFEQADLTLEINTTRGIAPQILRHKSFFFQEFSQRYADTKLLTEEIPQVELRRQDVKNRQNSTDDLDPELVKAFHQRGKMLFAESQELYDDMLESGVAKESARFYLPIATPTRLYMKGTVRSWIHYISLRAKPATQKEHRDIAEAAKCIFCCQFPDIAEALEWERSSSCPDCNDAPSITLE